MHEVSSCRLLPKGDLDVVLSFPAELRVAFSDERFEIWNERVDMMLLFENPRPSR